jgi:hypothetical protein
MALFFVAKKEATLSGSLFQESMGFDYFCTITDTFETWF